MEASATAWAMTSDWAISEGQLAMRTGNPTNESAVGGYWGDKLKRCSHKGKMYRWFVTSVVAVVELSFVFEESRSPNEVPGSEVGRERKGTRVSYPVARITESTSSRYDPSTKTTDVGVK